MSERDHGYNPYEADRKAAADKTIRSIRKTGNAGFFDDTIHAYIRATEQDIPDHLLPLDLQLKIRTRRMVLACAYGINMGRVINAARKGKERI